MNKKNEFSFLQPRYCQGSSDLPRNSTSSRFKRPSVRYASDREELFNRIAPVYDNLNDLLSLGQHRIWKHMAESWSGAKTGDTLLDLCCGSGGLTFLMSEKAGSYGKVMHSICRSWKKNVHVYSEQAKLVEDYYSKKKKLLNFQVSGAPEDAWQVLLAALHLQHINALIEIRLQMHRVHMGQFDQTTKDELFTLSDVH